VTAMAASFDIRPLSPAIGAEIVGLDIARPLDDATVAALVQAWTDHIVLLFRRPDLAQVMFSDELFRYDPGFSSHMQGIMQIHREALLGYLRQARKQGLIDPQADPAQLFRIIVGSMRFTITQWNLSGQAFDLSSEGQKLLKTIKKLIEVKK